MKATQDKNGVWTITMPLDEWERRIAAFLADTSRSPEARRKWSLYAQPRAGRRQRRTSPA